MVLSGRDWTGVEWGKSVYLVGRREDRLSASLGDHDGAIFALDLVERGAPDHLLDMVLLSAELLMSNFAGFEGWLLI
mgnify:CR=1 FL=1